MNLENYIARVDNYPTEGVIFRDITPLMADGEAYRYSVNKMVEYAKSLDVDVIAGPEARGFIFGCPVATDLGVGFVPVRKPKKLPRKTIEVAYDLEYGSNVLTMHEDAIKPGQRVLIVDDLLATGGTVKAAIDLVEKLGGIVAGCAFLIELDELEGGKLLEGYDYQTLLHY